ncbi:hypothetical protein [Clostridium butyricum]|uniref:hypothetical protein n=1 Tax=Clostridium butyricum TaxID=1492 RepID=UPI002107E6D1|nr:hypothetical protein [Clostridium butyricum]MCQ2014678.1 hypothetical protein [Clostridium butyricum]MCQ2026555.1 hypothetical protein [Clostridium butyricum]
MSNISSKATHMISAEAYISCQKDINNQSNPGILVLTNFGFVYGKIHKINFDDKTNVANVLLDTRNKLTEKYVSQGDTMINDGSHIVIDDATVKYSNNMTLNFAQIIILIDQIVGYYPVDLSSMDSQLNHQ